jgi:hypothetical protein
MVHYECGTSYENEQYGSRAFKILFLEPMEYKLPGHKEELHKENIVLYCYCTLSTIFLLQFRFYSIYTSRIIIHIYNCDIFRSLCFGYHHVATLRTTSYLCAICLILIKHSIANAACLLQYRGELFFKYHFMCNLYQYIQQIL